MFDVKSFTKEQNLTRLNLKNLQWYIKHGSNYKGIYAKRFNTLFEKEKMPITSIYLFSQHVFFHGYFWLTDYLMPNTIFNTIWDISRLQKHLSMLSGVFLPVLRTMFFPCHWLLSNITIVNKQVSDEKGMTVINLLNELSELRIKPATSSS